MVDEQAKRLGANGYVLLQDPEKIVKELPAAYEAMLTAIHITRRYQKHHIRAGTPAMLVEEGNKWINVAQDDLPVPPLPA